MITVDIRDWFWLVAFTVTFIWFGGESWFWAWERFRKLTHGPSRSVLFSLSWTEAVYCTVLHSKWRWFKRYVSYLSQSNNNEKWNLKINIWGVTGPSILNLLLLHGTWENQGTGTLPAWWKVKHWEKDNEMNLHEWLITYPVFISSLWKLWAQMCFGSSSICWATTSSSMTRSMFSSQTGLSDQMVLVNPGLMFTHHTSYP